MSAASHAPRRDAVTDMADRVRALTVRQPWAWCIAHAGKLVENRTDCKNFTGELLIHAGAGWSKRGESDQRVIDSWRMTTGLDMMPPNRGRGAQHPTVDHPWPEAQIHLGRIVAVVHVVECHVDDGCCRPWGESEYTEAGGAVRTQLVHYVFDNVRPVDGPHCAGRMGLWYPTDEIVALTYEALDADVCPHDPGGQHFIGDGCDRGDD